MNESRAVTHQVLDGLDGPAVLVGHSYAGVVITEAGNHPGVAALTCIAAFAPDEGESVSSLIADPPPGAPVPPILPPQDGFLFLDRETFAASFAADVPAAQAAFMADSQVPWGVEALGGAVSEPAWQSKPSWYLVSTDDRMIPPAAQWAMSERAGATVSETPGSHAVYVSRPAVVAAVIAQAAESLGGRFVPDVGETQGELIDKFPGSEVLPVSVPVPYTKPDGTTGTDLYLSKGGQAAFAADVSTATFRLRQATQRPFDADSFIYPTQAAAWRTIPSWGLVAGRDKAIPPAAERWMYGRANFRKVVEVPTSSHVARISHPKATAKLIEGAARATR